MTARPSSSIPTVMNSASHFRSVSSTPTAPYRASTSSTAVSTIRRSTSGRLSSDASAITASRRRRSCFAPATSAIAGIVRVGQATPVVAITRPRLLAGF